MANSNTPNETNKAPINAITPTKFPPNTAPNPSIIANVAPSDAPDDIPKIYGSARGFFTIACITTPLILNAIPIAIANTTRGNLIIHTTSCIGPVAYSLNDLIPKILYPKTL